MNRRKIIQDYWAWHRALYQREREEIRLARVYAKQFGHGTPNHLHYELIAKLADEIDVLLEAVRDLGGSEE